MSTKLLRQVDVSVKAINIEERIIDAVASDESVDRMGDVIIAAGWILDNYKKNPVVTFCHDYRVLPVAKTINVWIEGDLLKFQAQFPKPGEIGDSEHAKLVETVWQMFQNGMLNAFSVGFMPKEMVARMSDNGAPTQGMTITKSELLEIAVAVVPANANALAVRMKEIVEANQKAGRVLSGKNVELINTAILAMQAAISSLEELLASAQNNADQQNGKQIFNVIGKVVNDILTRKEGDS